jgi:hypothetical protein
MKYKLFVHNLASTSFQDYLVGPIEGEVDVGILSTKSTLIQLQERGHKLFLHAYDSNGRHVGVDHVTGEIQIQIPGAYYSDEGHVAFVALPADFVGFRVAVDATGAEESVESFDLTISVLDESNVMLQRTKSSDIQKGENIEYLVSVVENAQEISITNMTATSSSTTTAITTSPQSVLDWIMNSLRELMRWLECLFLRKCG